MQKYHSINNYEPILIRMQDPPSIYWVKCVFSISGMFLDLYF